MTPRLIVFDADDTLRRTRVEGQPCPRAPGEWELLPGVREALAPLPWGDALRLGIASNQDQVGYGLIPEDVARALLRDLVEAALGRVPRGASLQICPHVPAAGCDCRKPRPGMLRRILAETGVPAQEALFVGDAPSDREAACAAGIAFAWADAFFRRDGHAR